MSQTRKYLDRKNFINKFEQIQLDFRQELRKGSQGVSKREASLHRSKERAPRPQPERGRGVRETSAKQRKEQARLNRSKESKESADSLRKSTHIYYIAPRRTKRSSSVADKHLKSNKSKELPSTSHIFNSTLEMQSFFSTHKKKNSNFSSTIGSRYDVKGNKSHIEGSHEKVDELLFKSECILERYRNKCEAL